MRRLGAILAGGRSSRFGSDKALALHRGEPLIGHVARALQAQCEQVVLCGRDWGGLRMLPDEPATGLGPMGGLCAALAQAAAGGFDEVLAAPCDLLGIPAYAAEMLAPAPAVADGQWLLGLWPADAHGLLRALLAAEGAVSARRWIAHSNAGARTVPGLRNVNVPENLQ